MSEPVIKISVIIPVYNSSNYIKKCLESLIEQSYSNWEAYVIDDASTDDSFKLLSHVAKEDSRIKVFHHELNRGPGHTRNEGIMYASERNKTLQNGEGYIVFLDSDDWIEKTYFQSIVEVAIKDKADVIYVDLIQENESGKFIKYERMSEYKDQPIETIIRHQMTGKLPWGGVRKAVKTNLIAENNIRFSSDAIGEEAIYSFKLLYNAKKVGFIEKFLYHYVIHTNSQSGKRDENPYGPVCLKMREYLRESNLYDIYKNTLTSFAFTAVIVSIYRNTQYYDFYKAIKQSKEAMEKFRNDYGFDLDKYSLELRTRCVLPLARLNFVFPIVMAAKLKDLIRVLK
ncbi:glycosyltransferase involved in cell wall biosynthesis [Bacillus sp. SLBN-46]|uniref:glycosyltransferase family 2 protein n=1 Tax=Bacillus sp. SLBN-46 TaxID=3042283 RepID=UPI0028667C7A|nr:glycosyltransferase family 2 protein [Bacillus sp. SLBN-46]MDR6121161.1 glycosyltransferase involved in cell wall biosynthesis [Bacillus sp. SLBN-46]